MFTERFRTALLEMRDDVACSLPICNRDKEIIFYYYTKADEFGDYCLEKVLNIFERDIRSGIVVSVPVDFLEIRTIKSQHEKKTMSPEDAYEVKKEYLSLYELFYDTTVNRDALPVPERKRLRDLFNKYVYDPQLREIYYCLGKDYFNVLDE